MQLYRRDYVAFALIALMMLGPLTAAMLRKDDPALQEKAGVDASQPVNAAPAVGNTPAAAAPTR